MAIHTLYCSDKTTLPLRVFAAFPWGPDHPAGNTRTSLCPGPPLGYRAAISLPGHNHQPEWIYFCDQPPGGSSLLRSSTQRGRWGGHGQGWAYRDNVGVLRSPVPLSNNQRLALMALIRVSTTFCLFPSQLSLDPDPVVALLRLSYAFETCWWLCLVVEVTSSEQETINWRKLLKLWTVRTTNEEL